MNDHDNPGFDAETALHFCHFRTLCKALATASGAFDMLPCNDVPMTVDPLDWVAQVWSFDLLGSFSPASVSSSPALLLVSQCPPENLFWFSSPGPHSSSQNGYCTNYQESNGSVCSFVEKHMVSGFPHFFNSLVHGIRLEVIPGQTCDERPRMNSLNPTRKNRRVTKCHIS